MLCFLEFLTVIELTAERYLIEEVRLLDLHITYQFICKFTINFIGGTVVLHLFKNYVIIICNEAYRMTDISSVIGGHMSIVDLPKDFKIGLVARV